MINRFKRYQKDLKLIDIFPQSDTKLCACGCGVKLSGVRSRWATTECNELAYLYFSVIKGNTNQIRKILFELDYGFCRNCGVLDDDWQADHITPVLFGGGGSKIDNFQTLCLDCHKDKTNFQMEFHRKRISSQAAVKECTLLL